MTMLTESQGLLEAVINEHGIMGIRGVCDERVIEVFHNVSGALKVCWHVDKVHSYAKRWYHGVITDSSHKLRMESLFI